MGLCFFLTLGRASFAKLGRLGNGPDLRVVSALTSVSRPRSTLIGNKTGILRRRAFDSGARAFLSLA